LPKSKEEAETHYRRSAWHLGVAIKRPIKGLAVIGMAAEKTEFSSILLAEVCPVCQIAQIAQIA